jgi:hypothetical protein
MRCERLGRQPSTKPTLDLNGISIRQGKDAGAGTFGN